MARLTKRLPALLWILAGLLLAVFGLRSFVGDVYPVASSSMEPTLRPGERVFMRYGNEGLERYDLVVVLDPAGRTIVKRLVGLPGEGVMITAGDVLIDGRPLGAEVPRPAPVVVFDSELHPSEEYFSHGGSTQDPWVQEGDLWRLEGRDVALGTYTGTLRFNKNIQDDRLDGDGQRVLGSYPVSDLVLECDVRVLEAGGRLRFELVAGLEIYSFLIDLGAPPRAEGILQSSSRGLEVLATQEFELPVGAWRRVRFRNLDDSLIAEVGGETLCWSGTPSKSRNAVVRGERIRFGGEACRAEFRRVRISRDLHYTERGTYGIDRMLILDADEIFVLGDNSASSQDSRELGALSLNRVLGVPKAVVWPLSRARGLGLDPSGDL